MNDPVHRRHVRSGSQPTAPADATRIVLRRRRCSERGPSRLREKRLWQESSLVVLALLAAGPVMALAGYYHEEIATLVRRTGHHLDWVSAHASTEAAPSRPYVPGAPAASHGGTSAFGSMFASAWGSGTSFGTARAKASAPAAVVNPPAHTAAAASFPVLASWASAGRAVPAHFAEHATSSRAGVAAVAHTQAPSQTPAPLAARVQPAAVGNTFVWNARAASTPTGTSSISWTNGLNWDGGAAPAATANADIQFRDSAFGAATTSNVDTNYTIHSLTFLPTATVYTLTASSGVSLTINEGGLTQSSANAQTLNLPVVLGAAQTWNVGTGAGTLAVNGVISGTNGFTKTGAGTLTLGGSAANTYTGLTSVTGGTLALAKPDNGSPPTSAVPGDLSIGNATSPGAPGSAVVQLRNSGQTGATTNVTIYPDGLFDLANGSGSGSTDNATDINGLTMQGGEVRLGNGGIDPVSITTLASATTALISSTNSYDNVELIDGPVTANIARGTATYDLDVQAGMANGTLTKTGNGVMRLAGNTNGGHNGSSITLQAGTIALANNNALGDLPDVTGPSVFTFAGGTLTADGGDRTVANPIALTGDATIGASLDGTPRAITFTGATTLTGSRTLTVNNTAATTFSGAVNVRANTLTMDGTGNTLISGTVSDGGAGGGLTKQGTGALTLTGNNTYSGNTTVIAGTLLVNNTATGDSSSGTGSGTVFVGAGGTLGGTGTIGGNVALGTTGGFSPVPTVARAAAVAPATSAVLAPGVNGAGTLTINGGLTLSSNTVLAITLGSTPSANAVLVGGAVTLAGDLELTLGVGVKPTLGEEFFIVDLLTAGMRVSTTFENAGAAGTFVDDQGNTYAINYNDTPTGGAPGIDDVSLTVVGLVPEPGTWAMLGLGAVMGLAAMRRRAGY